MIVLKRKIAKASVIAALMLSFVLGSFGASAATYSTWATRGVKYLCWSKDSITWSTNSSKITAYDATQTRSGILVNCNGISKEKARSTNTKYSLLCKHTLLVGAEISGITLGWNTDVNDRVQIYRSGSANWSWDV